MKIIVDKIDAYPRHALTRADVRLILSSVPPAWSEQVKIVRLSSSRSATAVALYAYSDGTLTIASRGCTKESALHSMLTELAAHALGFKRGPFQHLQARYQARVESLVSPLMTELWLQLSRKTTLVDYDLQADTTQLT
jgi:hypothetical protein